MLLTTPKALVQQLIIHRSIPVDSCVVHKILESQMHLSRLLKIWQLQNQHDLLQMQLLCIKLIKHRLPAGMET